MRRRSLLWVILAMFWVVPRATAEPLTLTSGFVIFTDEPGEFVLAGEGFEVRGSWYPQLVSGTFWHDACAPCLPGTVVDFGTTTYRFSTGLDALAGGSVGGITYQALFYDGVMTFRGPEVIAPAYRPGDHTVTSGPFAFEASLAVYAGTSQSGAPLFSATLLGGGNANIFFGSDTEGASLILHDVVYGFEPQAPVPEPATLLLVGMGLTAAAARRRTRSDPSRSG